MRYEFEYFDGSAGNDNRCYYKVLDKETKQESRFVGKDEGEARFNVLQAFKLLGFAAGNPALWQEVDSALDCL